MAGDDFRSMTERVDDPGENRGLWCWELWHEHHLQSREAEPARHGRGIRDGDRFRGVRGSAGGEGGLPGGGLEGGGEFDGVCQVGGGDPLEVELQASAGALGRGVAGRMDGVARGSAEGSKKRSGLKKGPSLRKEGLHRIPIPSISAYAPATP